MRRVILMIVVLFIITPNISYAQIRINAKLDISSSEINNTGIKFAWDGKEIEIEKEFEENRLFISGFAIGARKEGHKLVEGSYLYARVYRKHAIIGNLELNPSIGIVYGHPGLRFERTEFDEENYTHVNLVRNIDIPFYNIKKTAVLYPEISLALRKQLKRFNIEPVVSVKIMRYGILKSNYYTGEYKEKIILSPSLGMRVGFKF